MNKVIFIIIAILCFPGLFVTGQPTELSGRVFDKEDHKILTTGIVFLEPGNLSSLIDGKGQYKFLCNPGRKEITIRVMGYKPVNINVTVINDTIIDINIEAQPYRLNEVLVIADSVKSIEVSRQGNYFITPAAIRETPKFFSEPDLMKSFQFMPGVMPGKDGSSDIYVRGGNAGQNIAVANGCYFFLPSHLLGFISPFDIDFLESAELIKDYFPAELGGGSSSVIKLVYKNPGSDSLKSQVRAGLLSSGITTEIPLSKIKSGITAGFRLGNYPIYAALLKKISASSIGQYLPSNKYSFFDGYFKFTHSSEKVGDLNYLFIYNYDNGPQETKNESNIANTLLIDTHGIRTGWNNMVHAIQWTPPIKKKLKFMIDLNYNRVSMNREMYQLSEKFIDGTRVEFDKYSNEFSPTINNFGSSLTILNTVGKYNFSGGFSNRFRLFSPRVIAKFEGLDSLVKNNISENYVIDEPALFFSSTILFINSIQIDGGLRITGGITKNANYFLLEPRFRFTMNPDGFISPHVNFVRISQFDHSLEGTNTGLRSMLWLPASKNFGPELSDVLSAGIQVRIENNYIFTFDAYIKKTSGMVDFKPGASFIYDESFDDMLDRINGRAYGFETGIIKRKGKLTGTATYTYSRSKREWVAPEGIVWIPTNADRPNSFNISMKYLISPKTGFGLNWIFISGSPATIYKHTTSYGDFFESKNNIRYFAYHRLDLSFRKTIYRKKILLLLDVDVNNVYNRKNTFYFEQDYDSNNARFFRNISLFPVMPSLTLTLKF